MISNHWLAGRVGKSGEATKKYVKSEAIWLPGKRVFRQSGPSEAKAADPELSQCVTNKSS